MKQVVISPFAQLLRNGKENPKNFPYWKELVQLMVQSNIKVIQIGSAKDKPIEGVTEFKQNLKFIEIKDLIAKSDTWISVDSFLQHLCAYYKSPRGIVIFGKSDPKIFGYTRNINMLKSERFLRKHQMWLWEQEDFNAEVFVTAQEVMRALSKILDDK